MPLLHANISLGIRGIYPSGCAPPGAGLLPPSPHNPTERNSPMRDLIAYALYSLIGLFGLLLVFSVFSSAESESQVEQMNTELMAFITGMRKAHRGHPDLYGTTVLPDADLINSGIAPTTAIVGTALQNSFGGEIAVTGLASDTFAVDYEDVPQEICIQALSRLRPDRRVIGARIGSTPAAVASATSHAFPISFADAADACSDPTNAIRIEAR